MINPSQLVIMVHAINLILDILYPYSWIENWLSNPICSAAKKTFNATLCKEKFVTKNTLSITYWSHS